MSQTRRTLAIPALLGVTLAGTLGAQQTAATCSVEQGKPTQLAKAYLAVSSAQNLQGAQKHAEAAKQLQAAVKALTEAPEKINNEKGRQLVLGKALGLWLQQPDLGFAPKRGTLGFATDPEGTIDLVTAIDEAFTPIEKSDPSCLAETAAYRGGKPWVALINGAIEHLNADRADSAVFYAKRSMQLYSGSPYGHMVLGNVAQRTNVDEAVGHFRAGIAASSDTIFAEAKRNMLAQLGALAADVADSASAAPTKQKYGAIANEAFDQLVKEFPSSSQATAARAGQARLRLAVGDTAGFKATYADQLANPSKYTYQELLTPAVAAARAGVHADAAKLFEAALSQNPYNRDALFNAALMYHEMGQFDRMLPFIKRLTEVDPSNGENWRLYAYAFVGKNKALRPAPARTAAGARARPTPANPAVDAQIRALNDSTVKYAEMAEKMPVKLEFTEWTNSEEKSTIAGTIQNKSSAAKSYSVVFEFLDKAGQVVDTQTATVASVAPNAKGRFSVTTTNKSAIAFRYKPLT